MLTAEGELVNVAVSPVNGEVEEVEKVVVVLGGGLDVVVVFVTGDAVSGATVTGALMPVKIKRVC